MRTLPMALAFSFGIVVSSIIAAASIARADGHETMVVQQAAPNLVDLDLGPKLHSHGDALLFGADVTTDDGDTGKLQGMLVTLEFTKDGYAAIENRIGHLQFTFEDGTILVAGMTSYTQGEQEMEEGQPQPRAIIGGTGAFMGASGEMVTQRNDDGTYTHTLTMMD